MELPLGFAVVVVAVMAAVAILEAAKGARGSDRDMSVPAAAETHTLWIVALGIGAVVVLVVIVLMALLLRYLKDIEARAARLVEVGDDVARNTASIEQDSAAESGVAFPHGTSRQVTWKEG